MTSMPHYPKEKKHDQDKEISCVPGKMAMDENNASDGVIEERDTASAIEANKELREAMGPS